MRRVYMDANATTPLLPEVMEAMRPYWMEHYGNASSIHQQGQRARTAVDQARETLAEFFGCHAAEVVFTSGGTEGDNTALFGLLHAEQLWGGWGQIALLIFVGIVLTFARAVSRTVVAGFVIHTSYNSIQVIGLLIATHGLRYMPGAR